MNGLEALEIILKNKPRVCASCGYTSCADCEKVLAKAQIEKELKAFEIIKEKEVDLESLLYYVRNSNHPLAFYNKGIVNEKKKLTEDEFNLLKEVLE